MTSSITAIPTYGGDSKAGIPPRTGKRANILTAGLGRSVKFAVSVPYPTPCPPSYCTTGGPNVGSGYSMGPLPTLQEISISNPALTSVTGVTLENIGGLQATIGASVELDLSNYIIRVNDTENLVIVGTLTVGGLKIHKQSVGVNNLGSLTILSDGIELYGECPADPLNSANVTGIEGFPDGPVCS
jgi:hypothetical protein